MKKKKLVEIARRLDQGENIDNDTESIRRKKDLVTKSKLVGTNGDREFVHQLESESQFDIETKSQPGIDETVTESNFLEVTREESKNSLNLRSNL